MSAPWAACRRPDPGAVAMSVYALFLSVMSGLFAISALVLLALTVVHLARRRGQRAILYLGLTFLSTVISAGFFFFRRLI